MIKNLYLTTCFVWGLWFSGLPQSDPNAFEKSGQAIQEAKDYPKARDYYQKALAEMEDPEKIALIHHHIGETYFLEGKCNQARLSFEKALAIKDTLNNPESSLATLVLLGKLDYQLGNTQEAFKSLDRGIAGVDPAHISKDMTEALKLVSIMVSDEEKKIQLPTSTLARYADIQLQQLMALHVQNDNFTMENSDLKASLAKQKYLVAALLASFCILLIIGGLIVKKQIQRSRKTVREKNVFVRDLIAEYDHKMIQLLIVKAEYEEFLGKRTGNGDLDDEF